MNVAALLSRFPSVLMAWRNLGRNRVRTALATLGVVIGVIAIASLGMAGAALQQQATAQLGDLTDRVIVSSGEDSETDGITESQVRAIGDVAPDATVVPEKSNGTELTARNGETAFVRVTGVTNASALYTVSRGEAPTRLESGALVSAHTADRLGLELGDPVEYDGRLYRIRGLIDSDRGFGPSGGGELVVPVSAMRGQDHYDSATVITDDGDAALATTDAIESEFNTESDEVLRVRNYASAQEQIESFTNTLELALLGIGSISLFVASVAILNVMLMSTVERRGEIGVLRAVGIRRGEVLRMILTEAAFLGAIGGLVGAGASLAIGLVIFHVLADDAALALQWQSTQYLLYGFGFALVASIASGLYPAWKAANDSPVEALRG